MAEIDLLRIELIRRGLSVVDLARMCGYARTSLSVEICAGIPNQAMRDRIEAGLDYNVALWSTPERLARRKACLDALGVDPYLCTHEDLTRHAIRLGIPNPRERVRIDRKREKIFEFLAANPRLSQKENR